MLMSMMASLMMNGDGVSRRLGDPFTAANTTSPLQIFVRAKKKINDVFQEIEEYVTDSAHFIESKCD